MIPPLWQSVTNVHRDRDVLRRRRFGVIAMCNGRLAAVKLRPYPKFVSHWEAQWIGGWFHSHALGDRCWLYYNQPWGSPNYLALQYLVSTSQCSLASARGALAILDWIAQLKQSSAIVCQGNDHFDERLPQRWGWEPHMLDFPGKHFIKRFYGDFSQVQDVAKYLNAV